MPHRILPLINYKDLFVTASYTLYTFCNINIIESVLSDVEGWVAALCKIIGSILFVLYMYYRFRVEKSKSIIEDLKVKQEEEVLNSTRDVRQILVDEERNKNQQTTID